MNVFSKLMTMMGLIGVYFIAFTIVSSVYIFINILIPNLSTTIVCLAITFLLLKKFIIKICNEIDNN